MLNGEHTVAAAAAPARVEAFSFGEPTPVLDSRGLLDYVECWQNGRWYEPPISLDGLARTTRSNVFLQSGLTFKRNMLARTFVPHRLLSLEAFEQLALDWTHFGMAYVENRKSVLGSPVSLQPCLAKYMRRGVDLESFFMVRGWREEHEFKPGTVYQLREADVDQEIYGMPEWLSALQSALLNESATLFRRRYYNNGSHAGFILYMTDAAQQQEDIDKLTGKPTELMRQVVRICEEGGRILDPFAGSGTTLLAAQLEGYSWIGCELTQHYADVTRQRLADL